MSIRTKYMTTYLAFELLHLCSSRYLGHSWAVLESDRVILESLIQRPGVVYPLRWKSCCNTVSDELGRKVGHAPVFTAIPGGHSAQSQ